MPIYEYCCQTCGHEIEEMQKFSDAPLVECPKCGKNTLMKQISATGFQLKGTGWYVTDFKDKKIGPPTKETGEGTEIPADKKEEKSDAKVDKTDKSTEKPTKTTEE